MAQKKRSKKMVECTHDKVMPKYKDEDFQGLDEYEVQERFPRFFGRCPDCRSQVILYSSDMHYIAGDW